LVTVNVAALAAVASSEKTNREKPLTSDRDMALRERWAGVVSVLRLEVEPFVRNGTGDYWRESSSEEKPTCRALVIAEAVPTAHARPR
jgi:hypothetical protein